MSIITLPTLTANSFTGEDLSGWWPWLLWDEIARVPLTETIHVFENAEVLLPLCIDWSVFEADPLHSEEVFSKTKEIYSSTFDSIDRSMTVDEHKRKLLKRSCKTWEE